MIYSRSRIQPEKKEKKKRRKTHFLHRGWNWRALYEMKARTQKEKYLFSLPNRGVKFDVMGIASRIITTGIVGGDWEGDRRK